MSSEPRKLMGPSGLIPTTLALAIAAFDWSGRLIAVACLSVMFILLFINVVMRYAAGNGIPWAYEIHAVLLPWLVAGGVVIASANGRGIAITLLPDLIPVNARKVLNIAVQLAVLIISVSVLWSSQPILNASKFQTLSTLGVKQIWGYSSLAYAFGALSIVAALDLLRVFAGGRVENNVESLS
ncbi:TRAP transporter small permease [Thalassovita sp.]|uniref:TRAP transporter small permease n=1 Tax=Thalassovita sp. TaxID=1979401 RepID=UPI0029DE7853|nr:TRAP transporter small permease subunit [Thalassovita sp.]